MKRQIFVATIFGLFFSTAAFASLMTKIIYDTDELEPGRWQYTYDVINIDLTDSDDKAICIEEFTIWFDFGLYENLVIETPNPPANDWDEIVVQPEPVLKDDGAYDALALSYGIPNEDQPVTVSGFAVSFDWLGDGEPGKQWYEIVDTETFETIDSGWTIPEPATLLLLGLGALALRRRMK